MIQQMQQAISEPLGSQFLLRQLETDFMQLDWEPEGLQFVSLWEEDTENTGFSGAKNTWIGPSKIGLMYSSQMSPDSA